MYALSSPANAAAGVGEETISQEYQIKAAFFYKFMNFVDWTAGPRDPALLCVLGENPFGNSLRDLIAVHDPNFEHLKEYQTKDMNDLSGCSLVFISRSEEWRLENVLKRLDTLSAVTVSDIHGFAQSGGMIELVLDGPNVRFVINQSSAKAVGIQFSSRLLALAKALLSST